MLIENMINEIISYVDYSIEELNNKQKLIADTTERIIGAGGDIGGDSGLMKQIKDNKRKISEISSDLIEWHITRNDLIELQSHCDKRPKDDNTFAGFLVKMGPQPAKYRLFKELLGSGWAERMNKKQDYDIWWNRLELITGGRNE